MEGWAKQRQAGWPVGCWRSCGGLHVRGRGWRFSSASRWRPGSRWRSLRRMAGGSWWRPRRRARLCFMRWMPQRGQTAKFFAMKRHAQHPILDRVCPSQQPGLASRGPYGRPLDCGSGGIRRSRAFVARPERASAFRGFNSLDDSLRPDTDHSVARDPDGHDADGAPAGGVSLSAPGAGHADCALQSDLDGPGADDDLVPDDPGAEPGGPAGG